MLGVIISFACSLGDISTCKTERECLKTGSQAYWVNGSCGVCSDQGMHYFVDQGRCVSAPAKNGYFDTLLQVYRCPDGATLTENACVCPEPMTLQLDGKSCGSGCGLKQGPSDGVCACVSNYTASLDSTTCIEIDKCKKLGGIVQNGHCVCTEGHVMDLTRQRCVAVKLEDCGANAVLSDGVCTCQSGFVLSLDGLLCHDADICTSNKGSVIDGRCQCIAGYAASLTGGTCTNDCGTGAEIPDPTSPGQVCRCMEGYALNLLQTECVDIQNCGTNAVVEDSTCKCKDGYYQTLTGTCELLPESGDDPCGEYQTLTKNVCQCDGDAIKTIDGSACVSVEESTCGKNAKINDDGKCQCEDGYVRSLDSLSCLQKSTSESLTCGGEEGSVVYKIQNNETHCKCQGSFLLDLTKTHCVENENKCGEGGTGNMILGQCDCKSGYIMALDGKRCVVLQPCGDSGVIGANKQCVCKEGLYLQNKECVVNCTTGYVKKYDENFGQMCVCDTNQGYVESLDGSTCVQKTELASLHQTALPEGKAACAEGFTVSVGNKQCVDILGGCGDHQVADKTAGVCVCDETRPIISLNGTQCILRKTCNNSPYAQDYPLYCKCTENSRFNPDRDVCVHTYASEGLQLSTLPLISELCLEEGRQCQVGASCREQGENAFSCTCNTGLLVFSGVCMETTCLGTDGTICGGHPELCLPDSRQCYVAPPEPEEEEPDPGPGPQPPVDPSPETETDDERKDWWKIVVICCGALILAIIIILALCCTVCKKKGRKSKEDGQSGRVGLSGTKQSAKGAHPLRKEIGKLDIPAGQGNGQQGQQIPNTLKLNSVKMIGTDGSGKLEQADLPEGSDKAENNTTQEEQQSSTDGKSMESQAALDGPERPEKQKKQRRTKQRKQQKQSRAEIQGLKGLEGLGGNWIQQQSQNLQNLQNSPNLGEPEGQAAQDTSKSAQDSSELGGDVETGQARPGISNDIWGQVATQTAQDRQDYEHLTLSTVSTISYASGQPGPAASGAAAGRTENGPGRVCARIYGGMSPLTTSKVNSAAEDTQKVDGPKTRGPTPDLNGSTIANAIEALESLDIRAMDEKPVEAEHVREQNKHKACGGALGNIPTLSTHGRSKLCQKGVGEYATPEPALELESKLKFVPERKNRLAPVRPGNGPARGNAYE